MPSGRRGAQGGDLKVDLSRQEQSGLGHGQRARSGAAAASGVGPAELVPGARLALPRAQEGFFRGFGVGDEGLADSEGRRVVYDDGRGRRRRNFCCFVFLFRLIIFSALSLIDLLPGRAEKARVLGRELLCGFYGLLLDRGEARAPVFLQELAVDLKRVVVVVVGVVVVVVVVAEAVVVVMRKKQRVQVLQVPLNENQKRTSQSAILA